MSRRVSWTPACGKTRRNGVCCSCTTRACRSVPSKAGSPVALVKSASRMATSAGGRGDRCPAAEGGGRRAATAIDGQRGDQPASPPPWRARAAATRPAHGSGTLARSSASASGALMPRLARLGEGAHDDAVERGRQIGDVLPGGYRLALEDGLARRAQRRRVRRAGVRSPPRRARRPARTDRCGGRRLRTAPARGSCTAPCRRARRIAARRPRTPHPGPRWPARSRAA